MANEIYDSTWWGNTIDTASSIGTSTEMIQGQFNLTKLGDELVTNGDFVTDSDWNLENTWTIENGVANGNGAVGSTEELTQPNTFTLGKTYKVVYEILNYVSGNIQFQFSGGSTLSGTTRSSNGTYTEYVVATANHTLLKFKAGSAFNGSIDNVSVKLVRATTVETSKCLADAIHRIGIQDIQN